tara:strand:+ start:3329 stop:4003 length:675 start_codon:yes stop_codon:yes gene_type:complete
MTLKKVKRKAVSTNPTSLLLYGAPKVGKTTMLSQLDDCLIIDTEKGARMLEGYIQEVNSRDDLINMLLEIKESKDVSYKYVAIDTIDKVAEWAEQRVCEEENVRSIADLAFGKGYGLVREKVAKTISAFKDVCEHLIIIGHRKVAYAVTEGNPIVIPESLDLTGKLKNVIMAGCDAIGYVYRNEKEDLMVSFKANESIEAGSRCPHLKGKEVKFEWKNIYKEKK